MAGRHVVSAALILSMGWGGCARERSGVPAPSASSAASATPPAAASAAPARVKPAGAALTEAAVRDLVDRWTAAQSNDDFAGYETLYAERFTGIKRAGTLTRKLGRADWMADRRTMIAPGLSVEARDVRVEVTPTAANVHFVQRYKSPRFEDVGPKQLVVVPTTAGPRIAREEMLSSMIQLQGLGKSLASRLHAAESGGVYLVAGLPKEAGAAPAEARLEYLKVQSAEAKAVEASLTVEQKAFVGRTFTVYDIAGKPCAAVVKSLSIRAVVVPHFGVLQSFDDREEYPDRATAERARPGIFYDLAGDEGRYLFGRFESPCPGARWAVEGGAPSVVPVAESPKHHAGTTTALRALPGYRKLQAELAAEHADQKSVPWETYGEGGIELRVFRPEKGPALMVASAYGGSGCSDFLGVLSAVFDITDPARPISRGVIDGGPAVLAPLAAVDLDGDGALEFVTGPDGEAERFGLIRPGPKGTFVREDFFSVPFLDCPC